MNIKLFSTNIFLLSLCCTAFYSNNISAYEEIKSSRSESYQSSFIDEHRPFFIGELGAKWQFPSDHLPRGLSIGDIHIAFWNILNKNYMKYIEKNDQGLRDSDILFYNVPANLDVKLTLRELFCVNIILDMINHSSHPRSMIALEETHIDVINYLKKVLPDHWAIVTPPGQPASEDLYLYDKNVFDFVRIDAVKYSEERSTSILTLILKERSSGRTYRFLQSHIPGGPHSAEACKKFAQEAIRQYNHLEIIVLMGDMNTSPNTIKEALVQAVRPHGPLPLPYAYVPINHPSHINTHLEASWYDHFFIYKPKALGLRCQASQTGEELHESLPSMIELFK